MKWRPRLALRARDKDIDPIFSWCIRESRARRCEDCGERKDLMDCAHVESRRHHIVRWHPANALCLCRACHMFYTQHPFDWTDFCRDYLGGDVVAQIRVAAREPAKWTKAQRQEIHRYWIDQKKLIQGLREQGSYQNIGLGQPPHMPEIPIRP